MQIELHPNEIPEDLKKYFRPKRKYGPFILRNNLIWYKPNCMPCSVKDRFTVDFENLMFFVKSKKYWFDNDSVKEPTLTKDNTFRDRDSTKLNNCPGRSKMNGLRVNNYDFRNKRAVWRVTTKPLKEAHFATYPPDLIRPMILAGCPEFVCNKCGKPRVKVWKIIGKQVTDAMIAAGCNKDGKYYGVEQKDYVSANANKPSETKKRILESMSQVKEYELSDCGCGEGFSGGIVLDPFFGAGTTGLVALQENRCYVGIELNKKYIKMAEDRIKMFTEKNGGTK